MTTGRAATAGGPPRALDALLAIGALGLAAWIIQGALPQGEPAAPTMARDLARITRDPLDVAALRDLGLALDREGQAARADALLSLVGRRTWRDVPTDIWLLRRRLEGARFADAFAHADALLRMDRDGVTRPVLFKVLAAAAAHAEARPDLEARLAASPWWRTDFLRSLAGGGDADGDREVLTALAAGPTPPGPDEYAPLINRLVAARAYAAALAAWREIARPPGEGGADLRDGDFSGAPDGTPFAWSAAEGVGGSSETRAPPDGSARRALRIDYDGYSTPTLPGQMLVLAPGRYRLSWRQATDPGESPRLAWRVRCADTGQAPAAAAAGRALPEGAGLDWREMTMDVQIPAFGCAAQWLELVPLPAERRDPVTAWYAAFRLGPAP